MAKQPLLLIHKDGDVTIVEFGSACELIEDAMLEPLGEELLAAAREADPPLVVLDLAKTRFFGSGFIELLLRVFKELQQKPECRLALCHVQVYCREVLEITHLDRLWRIAETRAEAVQELTSPA